MGQALQALLAQPQPTSEQSQQSTNFFSNLASHVGQSLINPIKGGINEIKNDTSQAFNSGINQIKQGAGEFGQGGDIVGPSLKIGAGVVNSALSPLAAPLKPVSNVIEAGANKLADTSAFKDPNSAYLPQQNNPYDAIQKGLEPIANAGTIAQGALLADQAPKMIEQGAKAVNAVGETAKSAVNKVGDIIGNSKSAVASKVDAADVLNNPHSIDEQNQAASQGRVQMQDGKKVVLPSKSDLAMQKAIQPLIDNGKIGADKELGTGLIKGDTQINNIAAANDEVTKIGNDTKSALQDSKATWNQNELKGVANKTEIPDPVKNETALAKNAASARDALSKIGQDIPKTAEGSQQVLQKFDDYLNKNYPKLFSQGRTASPLNQYLYGLRDSLNDWSANKLPEGNLPSGESYRDARLRQYNLLNAKEEMTAKLTREFPEQMSKFQRVMKAHPALRMGARILSRQLLRVPITMGEGEIGITQLERSIAKPK